MRFEETILGRLGKTLHVRMDDTTHEPMPRRSVELIQYLDEQERRRGDTGQAQPEPRRR
jgi:hypothetical protein